MSVPVSFYLDSHIPSSVAKQCRRQVPGIEIIRAQETGMEDADDNDHWRIVLSERHVLVTADKGFLARAAQLRKQGQSHPCIIYVAPKMQGDPCIGPLVKLITFVHEAIVAGAASIEDDLNNRLEHIRRG